MLSKKAINTNITMAHINKPLKDRTDSRIILYRRQQENRHLYCGSEHKNVLMDWYNG